MTETLRKRLQDQSAPELDNPKQVILEKLSKHQQQSLFDDHDPEETLYQKVVPCLSEIVRRAQERFKFSDLGELKPYLYGVFSSSPEGKALDICYRFIDKFLASLLEPQPDGELSWEELEKAIQKEILSIFNNQRQPTAGELLELLINKFDWRVRHLFLTVIHKLRSDSTIKAYIKDYLKTILSDEEINNALRGNVKPDREFKSTLDDLMRQSLKYRKSQAFREMIEFTARFRDYAPYNNFLIKIQNPSCSFYATEKDWRERFGRRIKEDARPMLILAPMHPVMLVYDLDSTEGPPLPQQLDLFGTTAGQWDSSFLTCTLENTKRDKILVQYKKLSLTHGGFVTSEAHNEDYKMRIVINEDFDPKSRYSTLCHELAHIYLGHLGADNDNWWPCRINLNHEAIEIEAEAVSYIVGIRLGLLPSSSAYLASYVKDDLVSEYLSVELIAKVAGKLLEMGERKLPLRKTAKSKSG